ncbi:MAG: sulfotransferase, partial [Nannocystaceae bacterium]
PIFASIFLIFPFPFRDEMMDLARFDEQLPASEREAIMGFYRDCVQRHLYVHGAERRFLSKNPAFTAKIDSLVTTFPDCQIICNVRSPFQAIPSLLSFVTHSFDQFGNDHRGNEWYEFMYGIASYWYRWPLERIPEQDSQQARFLTYPALVGALETTIQELYVWLDLEVGERWSQTLAREVAKAKAYKSTHSYDLATYGLTQERIYEDLQPIFERFGFDGVET